jgi:hypothetical protein
LSFHVPEDARLRHGPTASHSRNGNNGVFMLPHFKKDSPEIFGVIASDGTEWERVSVSFAVRCPSWREMCYIKSIFWDHEDCVVQYHPRATDHINFHPFCLHLWRPVGRVIPEPPSWMVGFK